MLALGNVFLSGMQSQIFGFRILIHVWLYECLDITFDELHCCFCNIFFFFFCVLVALVFAS